MDDMPQFSPLSPLELQAAMAAESKAFESAYLWLEKHMPPSFLDAADQETRLLIARNLLNFERQDHFSPIYFKHKIIVLCLDGADADLRILKNFTSYPVCYYRTFSSNAPPPSTQKGNLRIALLYFRDLSKKEAISMETKKELFGLAKEHNPKLKDEEITSLVQKITPNFLHSMKGDRLALALEMFFKAKTHTSCQYEVRKNENWQEKDAPSLQIVLAWRNVPKEGFLYRLAQTISRRALALQKVVGTYIDLSNTETILILSLGLHGAHGKAAWEEADIDAFLREFSLIKYFETDDTIGKIFLDGTKAHIVRNMADFVHQTLVYADPNLYAAPHVQEGLCRHPEITDQLCHAFAAKFDPKTHDLKTYNALKADIERHIEKLDTGQAQNDQRRKQILKQALNFLEFTLKTNFYEMDKSGFSFRLDPKYLDLAPIERKEKFPQLPYAIFFIRGMHYLGFSIRFKDLARGGVRTVLPKEMEQYTNEINTVFSECYNLAYTQQKKNKDIPEGGAKTVILLKPFGVFAHEEAIYRKELEADGIEPAVIEEKLLQYRQGHRFDYLFESQRSFIDSFLRIINCHDDGTLKATSIVDYWKRPEYIYLGPDENMHNEMIGWIVNTAVEQGYKPGRSFMSSKPGAGINHKEFGVTSLGVHVYLEQTLLSLNINPKTQEFTVKISGGPDGDVAGNELLNLAKHYPKTAKVLALTDVSGTIYDPKGLDLTELSHLFTKSLPIREYPPQKLNDEGFLLDLKTQREVSSYAHKTLLWRKIDGKLSEEYLSEDETNHLYRTNVHQTKTDVFLPCGGRPRTLNDTNYTSFLDETGKPTARAIVEGANLYLTPLARRALEKLDVLILKDSSCNKGGVICSSFEVLAGLTLTEEEFLKVKPQYVQEVLHAISQAAYNEARLLLDTHAATGQYLTDISEQISEKINLFKYQLLDYLETIPLIDPSLIQCLLNYCPPLLSTHYKERILQLPEIHKKAIIASYLASHLVYKKGISWSPSIADVLSSILPSGL